MLNLITRRKAKAQTALIEEHAETLQNALHGISRMRHYTPEEWAHIAEARKELARIRTLLGPFKDKRSSFGDRDWIF